MDDATDVRIAAQQVLLTAECSTSNLKKEEIQAIRILRSDKSVVILPADKGNVTVKMDRDNYDHKIDSLLSDQTYSSKMWPHQEDWKAGAKPSQGPCRQLNLKPTENSIPPTPNLL